MSQQQNLGSASRMAGELKTSAHVMMLEPGVYTVSRMTGSQAIDVASGLPDIRVSKAPEIAGGGEVEVVGFRADGWIRDGAALVRVSGTAAPILITIYQRAGASEPAPRIQVQQIAGGVAPAPRKDGAGEDARPEIAAHIQRRGDVVGTITDWMGEPGSQRWIEGFSLAPSGIAPADVEYQAVLGRGWLSPWSDSGQYCGSRGMALPILGLRVRLKGAASATHTLRVSASFTDGTRVGPVEGGETCEAESLAPLEAFKVELAPVGVGAKGVAAGAKGVAASPRPQARATAAVAAREAPGASPSGKAQSRSQAKPMPDGKPDAKPTPAKAAAAGRRR